MAAAKKSPRSAANVIAAKIAASRAKARASDAAAPARLAKAATTPKADKAEGAAAAGNAGVKGVHPKSANLKSAARAPGKSATGEGADGKTRQVVKPTTAARSASAPKIPNVPVSAARKAAAPKAAAVKSARPSKAGGFAPAPVSRPLDLFATMPPPVVEAVEAMALRVEAAMIDPVHAGQAMEAPMRETQAQLRAVVESGLDESVAAVDRWRAATRSGAAALEADALAQAKAMRTIQSKLIEVALVHTQAGLDLFQAMLAAPTLPDALALQVDHARKSVAVMAAQTRDLAEIAQRLALDAFAQSGRGAHAA
jgi:histone H1/5